MSSYIKWKGNKKSYDILLVIGQSPTSYQLAGHTIYLGEYQIGEE